MEKAHQLNERISCLDNVVQNYSVQKNMPLLQIKSGNINSKSFCYIAEQYYPICLAFPLMLAALISKIENESLRLLLMENLYDEHGCLNPEETHTELFRKFMKELNIASDLNSDSHLKKETREFLDSIHNVCFKGKAHEGLAMFFVFESLFSSACEMIFIGLQESKIISSKGIEFFKIHSKVDVDHAEQMKKGLFIEDLSSQEWEEVIISADKNASLMFRFFNSIPVL